MKRTLALLTAGSIAAGCATGYGTLAATGVGVALGTVGTVASASRGEKADGLYIVQGAALGALFGVIGAAIAASIGRKEGQQEARKQAADDATKKSSEARIRALEEALKERGHSPAQEPSPAQ
jgi:hypothetical protein